MKPNDSDERGVFVTLTSISDTSSWWSSLVSQLKQLREERRNPPAPIEITAERDPSALQKLVDTPSSWASLIGSIKGIVQDTLHPRTIETTATPVEVGEIWSKQDSRVPGLLSLAIHLAVVALILVPWASSLLPPDSTATMVQLYTPTPPLIMPFSEEPAGGGGGGGDRSLTPPSLGVLPRAAEEQLAPPTPEVKNPDPILVVEPTIIAPQMASLPQINLLQLGDPEGIPGPPSAGPGSGGGIGSGTGGGVGSGSGPGFGPGEGGGTGNGTFRVGGGVSAPTIIRRVEPQYSEEARKARYQGMVVLEAIVRKDGTVQIVRVVRSLGFGLDESAIKALQQWQFRPAMMNGEPVNVTLNIEVNFNLR
jgi:TonB family protein